MTDPVERAQTPRRRSRAHRVTRATALLLLAGGLAAALGVLVLLDRTMTAPDWLRDRVEARIEQNLGGVQIAFGDIDLVVNRGWRPRVRLRDVELSDADGRALLSLADAEASLAMRPLLRGQVQPKSIALRGALATLRRSETGELSLVLGDTAGRAAGLPQLVEGLDRALRGPQLSALTRLELSALTLRFEDARADRVWTVDGGRAALDRDGDALRVSANLSLLSGRDFASTVEANYETRLGQGTGRYGFIIQDIAAQDIAAQSLALSWLDVLRAPISGALRGQVDADGGFGPLSATLQIGAGVLQPTDATRPIPFRGARSYFTYDPENQVIDFDELSVQSDWVSGVAEGSAWLGGIAAGRLDELVAQVALSGVSINPDGLYDTPLRLPRATADLRLALDPFSLTLGEVTIRDSESLMRLAGTLDAAPAGWVLSVDGELDRMTPERLVALWPQNAAPKPRDWVARNLTGGTLSGVNFALRAAPGGTPDVYVDFDYAGAAIRFLKTMPPITGAVGQASLVGDRLVTTTTAGRIDAPAGGALDVAGTSFIIPDIGIPRAAPGILRLVAEGDVTAVLSLLDLPPLEAVTPTGLPVDVARGRARATGTLSLPLKDRVMMDEIAFHLDGELRDVASERLLPGRALSAAELRVTGDQDSLRIAGPATLDGLPVEAAWTQPLGPASREVGSVVSGRAELSRRALDTFGVGLPDGSVSGTGEAAFSVALRPGGPPLLSLESDLRGVGLRIPALGWSKPAGGAGALSVAGTLGPRPELTRVTLDAAGLRAEGEVTTRAEGGLDQAVLSRVALGDWLDARVRLIGRGGQAAPDIELRGGTMDLRRATFGDGGTGAAPGGQLRVALNRMQITDTLAITDLSGDFATAGGLRGSFSGKLNGITPVTGEVEPMNGRSQIRVAARDAGGVFRDAGILRQARGGDFSMLLQPVGASDFNGWVRVTGTRVIEAPAMAALLNAVSGVGLLDEIAGNGIQFTEVDARFRLGEDRITVYESSAIGPSIGLSMDGVFDTGAGRLNMQGVISPVYLINQVGSLLTRKGEGLFGFTYTLTGPADAPAVAINPLSALTPGMLREVFRAPAPVSGTSSGTAPGGATPRRLPDVQDGSFGGR